VTVIASKIADRQQASAQLRPRSTKHEKIKGRRTCLSSVQTCKYSGQDIFCQF